MTHICLIGESDPFIARLLERFAEESGLQVARAHAGQELLALARQLKPQVLVLDVELPGDIRGWQAVETLAADLELCHIPIISCSWLSETEARELVQALAGHLQKPELHYRDFVSALGAAGLQVDLDGEWPEIPAQTDSQQDNT